MAKRTPGARWSTVLSARVGRPFFEIFPQTLGYDLLNIQPLDGSPPVFSSAPYISWQWNNGVFSIVGISGLTTGVPYTVTIRVWWPAQTNN